MIATRKNKKPLIRYAGSAAETSIGSKPIGGELNGGFYLDGASVKFCPPLAQGLGYRTFKGDIPEIRAVEPGRYTGLSSKNQKLLSTIPTQCGR
ncbi:MAG: hypothetical protein IPN64_01835 [Propionivibrio sp.]|nr:hypothetical protein [Propionivibrio sp.]